MAVLIEDCSDGKKEKRNARTRSSGGADHAGGLSPAEGIRR